ncbi:hypothetical protein ACX0HA_13955 [Flavobacterium hauense]
MKQALLLIVLLFTLVASGQNNNSIAFDVNNYSPEKYNIKTQPFTFNEFRIEVTHVSPKDDNQQADFICRFWILIKSGNKVIDGRYYDNSESLGGCSGIYVDQLQPKDYFILTKFGDYNGELLLIDTTGKIQQYHGGIYHISSDSKYLFSTYDSDLSGITIFDLSKNKLVFTSDDLKDYIYGIYYKDGKYFGLAQQAVKIPFKSVIHTFNPKNGSISRSEVDDKYVKKSKLLNSSKLPADNCQCGNVAE